MINNGKRRFLRQVRRWYSGTALEHLVGQTWILSVKLLEKIDLCLWSSIRGSGWPARWKRSVFENLIGLTMLGIQILKKLENTSFSMNNENFQGEPEWKEPGPRCYTMVQGQVRCFLWKNATLNSVLERRSEVYCGLLERGFYVWHLGFCNEVVSPGLLSLIFWVDLVDAFLGGKSDLSGYNVQVLPEVIVAWKADNPKAFYTTFRYCAPVLVWAIKI